MKIKKKVLIIDLGKSYGGAEKLIENLLVGLRNDFDMRIAINLKGEFILKSNIIDEFNKITLINTKKTIIKNIFSLIKYIKRERIDIIHCHGTPSNAIGILLKKLCKVKFISTIHSDLNYEFDGIKKLIYLKIEKLMLKYCDECITVSENLKNKIIKRYGKEEDKFKLIYNGIEINNLADINCNSNTAFTFLFVGRLVEIKNIPLLLEGLKFLKDNKRDFYCNIIGEGEERDNLEKLSVDFGINDNVNFLGFKSNIQEYMINSNALILTSKMEGIPITIIEAFANKLPVIASAVGGITEMIVDGENGVLYDIQEKEKFFKILLDIIDNKINLCEIKENEYKIYLSKWNREKMLYNYNNIYLN